ncbi:glycosyltransferase [Bacillus paranthracis]|uniref:glycosyltransferase n=1 Tax=Bacillus paranthracis TaxID=2026186 RepID=UPI0002B8E14F|nr:glycosyltransferase [Bacillus paranthracis]
MKTKILILINTLQGGGAERVVQILSKKFVRMGMEVTIVTLEKAPIEYEFDTNIKIVHLKTGIFNKGIGKFINIPLQALELIKVIKMEKPNSIISFLIRANLVNAFTRHYGMRYKLILSERTTATNLYKEKKMKNVYMVKLIKHLYRKADNIIAISNSVKDSLIEFGVNEEKIKVIYNPIDGKNGSVRKVKSDANRIITVGRLINSKDHINLLKAFVRVREKIPNATLEIVGKGELFDFIKEQISELGVSDSVQLTGWSSNPVENLRESDLFVLSSKFEGFGNVILEAMSVSLPIISTDCYGPSEILDNGKYGVLVPIEDDKKLGDSIIRMLSLENEYKQYSEMSMKRINDFNIESISNQYLEVILSQ